MKNNTIGTLFVVSAPSGGGKTSLVRHLVKSNANLAVSISHTTRAKRPLEVDGTDYFFVNEQQFAQMVADNAFLEHAHVFDYHYGTSRAQINDRLESGIDIMLDIDWQGAMAIKSLCPAAVTVFIIPPSIEVLQERLLMRKQDDSQVIEKRMARACSELSHYKEFDYLIVNDVFEQAADNLLSIVKAARCTLARQQYQQEKLLISLL